MDTTTLTDHVVFNDKDLRARYANKKIPISTLWEAYFDGEVDIKGDLTELVRRRHGLLAHSLTADHFKFFVTRLVPEVAIDTKSQDKRIVREHYDRGDDFFNWFLGPRMVYTCAYFQTGDESLEQAQDQKMDLVCRKLDVQKGERMLDIGCGWGTLALHAAKNFGADATGVTISENQTAYGNARIKEAGLSDHARLLCLDYRDIPKQKFDKISCLEMAEHVGHRNFQKYLHQVSDLMTDDGIFYLQIAGPKRHLRLHNPVFGLFMAKYVFPGADASRPLSWSVDQLERAGFEIHTVENVGIHYSQTIQLWHDNWVKNRAEVVAAYGERWFRIWHVFLAWATHVAAEGESTAFQIVANKNVGKFNRRRWFGRTSFGERRANPAAFENK